MRAIPTALAFVLGVVFTATSGELEIAREALRDGLLDVARTHAARAAEPAARVVIAESYAREGRWKDLLGALGEWSYPDDDALVYYRALALVESDKASEAGLLLADRTFADAAFARRATLLRARIARIGGSVGEALKIMDSASAGLLDDEDSKMYRAELLVANGDRSGADELWRSVVARGTNASERAFVTASVNLGDEDLLRTAFGRATNAEMRRQAGYGLGRALLFATNRLETATNKFDSVMNKLDEGIRIVRSLVREAPDALGAREGLSSIAEACLSAGRFKEAVEFYRETFETWPDAVKISSLHDGLGWAFKRLGRLDEALASFVRAEETAETDDERAQEIVRQGDVLALSGKPDAALVKYRDVLARYPATESAKPVKRLIELRELEDNGRSRYNECRYAEAQEIFSRVAEKDPSCKTRMDYCVVLCLYGQGLIDEAATLARTLTRASDASVRALATLWLAKCSYNGANWKESRDLFAAYAELEPKSAAAPGALVWSARAAFAANDFAAAIQTVSKLIERYPASAECPRGLLVQGESLIEMARFDEAVLVLDRAASYDSITPSDRLRARLLGADALFAMGADNALRYQEALEAYRVIRQGESLDENRRLVLSYKIAKSLEKLKRLDEAVDAYYADVVLAYRSGRARSVRFDNEARASFSRAAFRLADEFESRGSDAKAIHVLELVVKSDVPAAEEAARRIERIRRKGKFL